MVMDHMVMDHLGSIIAEGQPYLAPAAAVVAVFLLMNALRRRHTRRPVKPRDSALAEPRVPRASTSDIRRDVDQVVVELEELSRRISSEIDLRFAKLEAAIRDADRRIAALDRLNRDAGERTSQPRIKDPDNHDARNSLVYELADAGFGPVDIARDLGRTPGEVELILNLRKHGTGKSN